MKSRSSHVRTKVVALLLSLVALWTFAAVVTVREGLNLVWLSMLNDHVGQPIESVVDVLQQERRVSVVYLSGTAAGQSGLADQRARTDAAVAHFRQLAGSDTVGLAGTATLVRRIDDMFTKLDGLADLRKRIDAGTVSATQVGATFTDDVNAAFLIYGALSTLDDEAIATEGRALVALSQAREVLSQEDALVAGALVAGGVTADGLQQFIQLVGTQRYLRTRASADLPPDDAAVYDGFLHSDGYAGFTALEDAMVRMRPGDPLPVSQLSWQDATQAVLGQLRQVILTSTNNAIGHATTPATWVVVRLILAGGLGLLAVIASVIMSITTARALVHQLEQLRNAAQLLAIQRLPSVVERLGRGEVIDVAAEAPPLEFGADEIGQVGRAFNAVQETAIRAAVEQAELRRGVREVFLGLARRTQALVHRQLRLLDGMERREADTDELADLFRVDHLATRMRRNAENLIVLAGAVPGRGWRKPVPMVDVLRGAIGEVEEYTRVTVLPVESASLAGRAVGDVIHLLAELIENALAFSPPQTRVHIGGVLVANGFAVEIEDRGLGMSEPVLARANEELTHPQEFHLSDTARLGLFVVGRLAARHGIRVRLRESPYGGTTAIVLIPNTLIVDLDASEPVLVPVAAIAADSAAHDAPEAPAAEPHGVLVTVDVPDTPTEPAPVAYTPSGLPARVRQARHTPTRHPDATTSLDGSARPPVRTPEEIRRMMTSYHSGGQRGRIESGDGPAGRTPDVTGAEPIAPTDAGQDVRGTVEGG